MGAEPHAIILLYERPIIVKADAITLELYKSRGGNVHDVYPTLEEANNVLEQMVQARLRDSSLSTPSIR